MRRLKHFDGFHNWCRSAASVIFCQNSVVQGAGHAIQTEGNEDNEGMKNNGVNRKSHIVNTLFVNTLLADGLILARLHLVQLRMQLGYCLSQVKMPGDNHLQKILRLFMGCPGFIQQLPQHLLFGGLLV